MANPSAVLEIIITTDPHKMQQGLNQGAASADKFADRVTKSTGRATSAFKNVGKGAGLAAGAIGALAVKVGIDSVKGWEDHSKVVRQTEAVLKSTGGAARVSAKSVGALADSIERKTTVDADAIQSGANLLLTFTNIRNGTGKTDKIFNQATQTITDMSAALGTEPKAAAIQLGKALNDPVKGVTALSKVGVSFNAEQKDHIKTLVASGKTMDAQKVILGELKKEFGGSAAALSTPGRQLQVTVNALKDSIGQKLVPIIATVAGGLDKFVRGMMDGTGAGGKFVGIIVPAFEKVRDVAVQIPPVIGGLVDKFREGDPLIRAVAVGLGAVVAVFGGFAVVGAVTSAIAALGAALPILAIAALAGGLYYAYQKSDQFRGIVDKTWAAVKNFYSELTNGQSVGQLVAGGIDKIKSAVTGAAAAVGGFVTRNREDFQKAGAAVVTVAHAIGDIFTGFVVPALQRALPGIKTAIGGVVQTVRGVVTLLDGIIHGDFSKIWDGMKNIVSGAVRAIAGIVRAQTSVVREAAAQLGSKVVGAIREKISDVGSAVSGFGHALAEGVRGQLSSIGSFFLRVGKSIVSSVVDGIKAAPGAIIGAIKSLVPGSLRSVAKRIPGNPLQFARGGMFAATAGVADRPYVITGEEAPRHPEFVIPTNPAYRGRAQQLLGAAGKAISYEGFASGGVIGPQAVSKMQSWANAQTSKNYPYVYGGGHGAIGVANGGFDCSGFVSGILGQAGIIDSPMAVRQPLQGALLPGPGKFVTVGIRGTSARNAHTMIKVGNSYYESGGGGNGAHRRAGWNGAFDMFHPANEAEGSGATTSKVSNPSAGANGSRGGAAPKKQAVTVATSGGAIGKRTGTVGPVRAARVEAAAAMASDRKEGMAGAAASVAADTASVEAARASQAADAVEYAISSRGAFASAGVAMAKFTETLADDVPAAYAVASDAQATYNEAVAKFGAGSAEAATALVAFTQSQRDYVEAERDARLQPFRKGITDLNAPLVQAQVDTPDDLTDDIGVVTKQLGVALQGYADAVSRGDADAIIEFGNQVSSLRGTLKSLEGTVAENTSALQDMKDSIDRNLAFAQSVTATENVQLARGLADFIGGQIVGVGLQGRAQTAGAGTVAAY